MKTISLLQPWAILAALGLKGIETRSRPSKHRGPRAIHASKGFPKWARELCALEPFSEALFGQNGRFTSNLDLPLGVVIATCQMTECCLIKEDGLYKLFPGQIHRKPEYYGPLPGEPQRSFGDYRPGRFAYIWEDQQLLPEPIPARGQLGVWEWEPPEGVLLFRE